MTPTELIAKHWNNKLKKFSVINHGSMLWKLEQLNLCLEVPGNVAEFGTYKGGSLVMMALLLKDRGLDKKAIGFDSFQGLPQCGPGESEETGRFKTEEQVVRSLAEAEAVSDFVETVPGWFNQTVSSLSQWGPYCFIHIDCDLYKSTKTVIGPSWRSLSAGGCLLFDDYGCSQYKQKQAVDEFAKSQKLEVKTHGHMAIIWKTS